MLCSRIIKDTDLAKLAADDAVVYLSLLRPYLGRLRSDEFHTLPEIYG